MGRARTEVVVAAPVRAVMHGALAGTRKVGRLVLLVTGCAGHLQGEARERENLSVRSSQRKFQRRSGSGSPRTFTVMSYISSVVSVEGKSSGRFAAQ